MWQIASQRGGRHTHTYRIRRADDGDEQFISTTIEVELGSDGQPRPPVAGRH